MKKLAVLFLFVGLISCNSQEKKEASFVDVKVEEFKKGIQQKGVQLVDVRTPKEFKAGHVKGAILINFYDDNFNQISEQKLDKNQSVYLYCRSGGRSAKAAKMFKDAGFKKVYNLLGGFNAWLASGQKIEK
jgi:rhodanese-related sulfurtransferase